MKYLLSDNEGVVEEFSKITPLQNILNQSIDYWSRGTGDVGVEISNNERLIFFRITQGFFIMYHPEYLSPKTNSDDLEIYTHYIGGQKFLIPSTCICSKEQTLEILENFIDKGTLKDSYNWVDFYSELGIFKNFRAVKILTGGLSGTHAEVRALNELLFELERKGEVITDVTLTEILGYNKQFLGKSKTQVMPRCADCFYLTELVRMISLN